MKNKLLILIFITTSIAAQSDMPEPYRSIKTLPEDRHGWFLESNRENLYHFILQRKPQVVVELGTWLGASAIFMAQLLNEGAILYAVDDWRADTDIYIQADASVRSKLTKLYQQFLSNVKLQNLTHKIIPCRMKTLEAAEALDIIADLIYVDASHDEDSVYKDIMAWYPKLSPNGLMCGDDWSFKSVQQAVKRAAAELNQQINVDRFFWYFTPKA